MTFKLLSRCGPMAVWVFCAPTLMFGADKDCDSLAKKLRTEVSARPERVLIIVEDAMVQNELCACEMVKAAIGAAKAEPKLVGQIVFTAVTIAPGLAATIGECSIAAAPRAAEEVAIALRRALGEGALPGPITTQEAKKDESVGPDAKPSNQPAENASEDAGERMSSPVDIAGIYLVGPGGGTAGLSPRKVPRAQRKPKPRVVIRPRDVTQGASDDLPP